jgi:hypothetical protein
MPLSSVQSRSLPLSVKKAYLMTTPSSGPAGSPAPALSSCHFRPDSVVFVFAGSPALNTGAGAATSTLMSSTSNTRVALGGIAPGIPSSP